MIDGCTCGKSFSLVVFCGETERKETLTWCVETLNLKKMLYCGQNIVLVKQLFLEHV